MSFKSLTFLLFLLLPFWAMAQERTQTIRGTIVDKDTRAPLIGANVVVMNSDPFLGATTDIDGKFRLEKVPVGRQNLQVTYIGYLERILSNVEVNSGKEVVLNLELEESVATLGEVEIKANERKQESINEMATTSVKQFTLEESGRYAGSRNEVSRMAANFAGVSNANDARNDIVIRGNSPNGLLWRLEGLDIPNPNHFSSVGSNGGAISMLNYNVIANSDFMTSAFPSEYGNATSGVFDLRLRNGNNEKREYMIQAGALGTEAMVEGPMGKNGTGSYLLNYRFSTTTMLTAMGIDFGFSGQADYQDVSFKFNLPTEKLGTFGLFGLGGINVYAVDAEDKDPDSFEENLAGNSNDEFANQIGIVGFTHLIPLSKKSYLKTIVGYSTHRTQGEIDSVSTEDFSLVPFLDSEDSKNRTTVHSFLKTKFNARNKLKSGIIAERIGFSLEESSYVPALGRQAVFREGADVTYLLQAYSQWQHKLSDQFTISSGLHYQQLLLNNSQALEPRIGASWQFAPRQSLNFGYGLHSQMQTLPVYYLATRTDNGVLTTNKDLGFTRSHHLVLGYNRNLNESTNLKVEGYYQYIFDAPVEGNGRASSFSLLNEGATFITQFEDSLVNAGNGRNLGLEITLERYFSRGFYYLWTTSLFDSRYRASDDVWRNTAFNGNYVSNVLVGKEFKLGDYSKLMVDLKVSMAGGRRTTPIDLEASAAAGEAVEIDADAFSEQQDDYFRTDAKVTYRVNRSKVSHEFFINVDNVFNTQNVFAQTYSPRTNQIENIYQLGMFPTFQYKILF
ncbi:MAG: carboxypeptidase regulatory-like domain-containing protein [Salibacteraceae bacterium]